MKRREKREGVKLPGKHKALIHKAKKLVSGTFDDSTV
jgi:hypothetical protein